MQPFRVMGLLLGLMLLAACGGPVAAPTEAPATPTEAAVAEATPTNAPTATEEPTPTNEPTATATTVVAEATAPAEDAPAEPTLTDVPPTPTEAPPTPTEEAVNWLEVEGQTEAGLFYLGNPDAPVTLTDYSDFL